MPSAWVHGGIDLIAYGRPLIIEDQEIWEECPYIKTEYRRLQRYVEVVKSRDKKLRRHIGTL